MAERIAACIVCRDEADKLERCLATTGWVDEVVVLDLESSDGSGDVAAGAGAVVHRRPPVPIVELVRNEVAGLATSDWILVLDPDERLAPGLEAALREAAADDACDAVVIPRTNYDLGHPPSHPSQRYEPQLRMYRRSRVGWPTVPNALPAVPEERLRRLPERDDLVILHDRSRSIVEVLDRSIRYAPAQAQSMLDRGEVFSARAMAAALWRETDTKLLGPRAWRDGLPGLLRAGILVGFKFHVWVELWQRSGGARTPEDDRFVTTLGRGLEVVRAASLGARRAAGAAAAVRARRRPR